MAKISKEEALKIAQMSSIDVHENELSAIVSRIESVLSYAERVKEIAADIEEPSQKSANQFREDVVVRTDPEPILAQAPEREENYFVVPKVLGNDS